MVGSPGRLGGVALVGSPLGSPSTEMVHSPVCRMSIALDSEGNAIILHELKTKHAERA